MLASMLQRRGNSDELDDEIFKNALTTNYLGTSSLRAPTYPLTLDLLAGVETVSSVKGLDSSLKFGFIYFFRFSLLCRLRSFASRFTQPHRSAHRRKLTESWEQNDYPLSRTGILYPT